jgi:hypothetical protein
MLPRKTLFIVGAGAGAELDMPLGDALSAEIAQKADIRFDDFGAEQISGDAFIMNTLRGIAKNRGEKSISCVPLVA